MSAQFFPGAPEEVAESGASRIKVAREARGLSRAELARRLGAPIRTLENWELGSRKPPEWIENLVVEKIKSMK